MKIRLPSPWRLAFTLFVIVPALAWFVVKPVRIVAPTWAGVYCPTASICLDDPAKYAEATTLHESGVAFVGSSIAPLAGTPRVIFCATEACARSFGLGERSAITVGTIGTVIGPRAWQPHYVRHELIHQLQAQRLGVVSALIKPSWFIEGMAYALSEDPRPTLAEPWQGYRARFRAWYADVGPGGLWAAAASL